MLVRASFRMMLYDINMTLSNILVTSSWRLPFLTSWARSLHKARSGGTLSGTLSESPSSCYFVPETKALSLEESDEGKCSVTTCVYRLSLILCTSLFSVPTRTHASYQSKAFPRGITKHIFRTNMTALPPLYEHRRQAGEGCSERKQHARDGGQDV